MAIPLSNPMVSSSPATPLNDTTNAGQTTANTAKVVDWTSAASVVDWSTPRKASDLCGQLKLFTELSPDHNTQRLLFRKVKKAFSEKSFLLASSQQQVRVLEARVKRMAPRKKKSVQTDPNTKFANIRDIKRAQEDAGERLISPSRIAEVELPIGGDVPGPTFDGVAEWGGWPNGGVPTYFIVTAVLYALCFFYSQFKTFMEHGVDHARVSLVTPHCLKVVIETNARWTPGQHVYLRFLTSGMHSLTAHPFTICSIPRHGQRNEMVFYIQPRGGITARLAAIARKSPEAPIRVLLDGPYGGVTDRWFAGFDRTLVVAGGAGAGFSLPMIEHILQRQYRGTANTEMEVIVATRDLEFREWYCRALDDIIARRPHAENTKAPCISISFHETGTPVQNKSTSSNPESPAYDADKEVIETPGKSSDTDWQSPYGQVSLRTFNGRPDVSAISRRAIEQPGSVGLIACGPASLVFDLSQVAAEAQKRILQGGGGAMEVWFYKENFSY
ncbi:hypothetical protein CLIM01_14028 [Colletotrichum limetticola]|uniref:ferric-chelate reductase (NADPH) n=1 Tax=Colletotrichum limetticola TaxID=1209924 RepID=A0ABQ9P936_9PEZI|nr:hypothetical protein CLIM01_14028 [Colletotrichum limetticola]